MPSAPYILFPESDMWLTSQDNSVQQLTLTIWPPQDVATNVIVYSQIYFSCW